MHCTVRSPAPPRAAVVLTAHSLEDRIARIETPAGARAVAEVILAPGESGAWQRWKPLASAPLAGWLYTARRVDASSRVDWILRALAHRARWSSAARGITQDEQLRDSLRSVSRLDDRQFTDVGWMLVLALFPWSTYVSSTVPTATVGER